MTELELIKSTKERLLVSVDEADANVDARELVRFADGDLEKLENAITRRLLGEPLQYIIGEWDFYNCNFRVGEGVLIPRPETELLVDKALEFLGTLNGSNDDGGELANYLYNVVYGKRVRGTYVAEHETVDAKVLDLCSGSGCIAVSIAKNIVDTLPGTKVFAVEKSPVAFEYLKQNIALNRVQRYVVPFCDDVLSGCTNLLGSAKGQFDLVVSNPPYVRSAECEVLQTEVMHEPRLALDGGADGLIFYRAIAERWLSLLKPGGLLLLECGEDQAGDIKAILDATSCGEVEIFDDFAGISRVVALKMY